MFPEFYDSGYVQSPIISASASPFNAASLTISFWLNIAITNLVQPATIVQYGDPTVPGSAGSRVNITWNSADLMVFDIGGGDSVTAGGSCSDGSFDCLVNTWHLWTFTYSQSGGTTTKTIWLDGAIVGVGSSSNAIAVSLNTPLLLGNQRMTWSQLPGWSSPYMYSLNMTNHLPGYLAQFNVWQRVLSSAEISAMATLGLYTNNAGLVLRYAFTEQVGTNISDSGGSGVNLYFNNVGLWFQQQPAWSGYFLQPLCLLTPTAFQLAGPPSSPNCQAVNSAFTVTVSVLDSAGAVVAAFSNGSVSLNCTAANPSVLASNVTISPSSAVFSAGVATFTVKSTAVQTLTLSVVDSGRLLLSLSSLVVTVSNVSSLSFASRVVSARQSTSQSISVFASTCGGVVPVSGPFSPTLTTSLLSTAASGHLTPSTPLTLTFNSSGWASASVSDSFNEAVTFSLQDTSGRQLSTGATLTAYWTAASASTLLIGVPYPSNGSQPTPSAFYAGSGHRGPRVRGRRSGGPRVLLRGLHHRPRDVGQRSVPPRPQPHSGQRLLHLHCEDPRPAPTECGGLRQHGPPAGRQRHCAGGGRPGQLRRLRLPPTSAE